MTVIKNAKDTPLNANSGTVPDLGDALLDWFQQMTFGVVTKVTEGFRVVETVVDISFMGVIQTFTDRQLLLKPEGQRAWSWFQVHAQPQLDLEVDAVIVYLGKQYRVMSKRDYVLYGYVEYHLVTDWTGSGPTVTG